MEHAGQPDSRLPSLGYAYGSNRDDGDRALCRDERAGADVSREHPRRAPDPRPGGRSRRRRLRPGRSRRPGPDGVELGVSRRGGRLLVRRAPGSRVHPGAGPRDALVGGRRLPRRRSHDRCRPALLPGGAAALGRSRTDPGGRPHRRCLRRLRGVGARPLGDLPGRQLDCRPCGARTDGRRHRRLGDGGGDPDARTSNGPAPPGPDRCRLGEPRRRRRRPAPARRQPSRPRPPPVRHRVAGGLPARRHPRPAIEGLRARRAVGAGTADPGERLRPFGSVRPRAVGGRSRGAATSPLRQLPGQKRARRGAPCGGPPGPGPAREHLVLANPRGRGAGPFDRAATQ